MSQPGSARAAAVLAPELADSGGVNGTAGFDPEGGGYAGAEGGAAAAYDGYAAGGYPAEGAEGGAYEAQQEQQEQQLEQQYKAADGGAGGAVAAEGAEGEYSPAAYLQQLHAHLGSLQGQRQELQQQLAGAAAAAYQQMSARLDTAGSGAPLPSGLPALAEELVVLQSVRQYLAYVQELQALTRHVEKTVRALQQQQQQQQTAPGGGGGEPAGFLQSLSDAVDGFSNAVSYAVAIRQLSEEGKVPIERLRQHASALLARVDAAQAGLRALLSAAIQQRLEALHWPPPLTVSGGGGGEAAGEAGSLWRGFAAGGDALLGELQQLLVVMLTLQRASQHEQFGGLTEEGQEGPVLWIAEELAAPLATRLRHHFASGLPTDRPDRPEWLFATALKAAQQCGPPSQELQPCVEAHQLQSWYSLPLEVARAVQAVGVNAVLGGHLLPQLVTAADPALWLHLADEAMQFEKRFAPLRGASLALPEDEEFLAAAHAGSTIELLFQQPQWQEGWLGAEAWDAQRQLEAACDAYAAWQPASEQLLAAAGGEEDLVPETPRSRGGAAWRREFWPPVCAEQVASLVGALVRRGGWVHSPAHKLKYMQAVPLAALKAFRERVSGLLQQAEQFKGLLGDTWLPRVGAAVCAAHYVEHQLQEPQGVLLLAELQDAAGAAGARPVAAAGDDEAAAAGGGGDAAAAAAAPRERSLVSLIEREANAFSALRKQWAYKLAKQAVDRFHQLFGPYKRNGGAFTAGYEEGQPPEQQAAAAAAAGPAAASPAMLLAADSLQQLLRALAQHLDAVVFRDVWKGVALAVNYALYNEVATEALFSAQGAAQLDADLSAMAAVFGEYTARPAAHFKESREACRLLALPWRDAVQLLAALEAQPRAAKQLLAPYGVKALNAEQAAVVLLQRLDVLTSRSGGAPVAPAEAALQAPAAALAPTEAAAVMQAPEVEQAGSYYAGGGYAGGGIEV